MADIKVKNVADKTIKTLNRSVVAAEKLKNNLVHVKTKTENNYTNSNEYGSDKINKTIENINKHGTEKAKRISKKSIKETKKNIKKAKVKIKEFKLKQKGKKIDKGIKNTKNTMKGTISTSKKVVNGIGKATKGIKDSIVATIKAIKAMIEGTKALIAVLIAGGSIALTVIIIICLVGLLFTSIFGIFFSGHKTAKDSISMNEVITELNNEIANKISDIQDKNQHDDFVINSDRAEWKDVIAIYSVKISKGTNEDEVMTLDSKKVKILKEVFWDMHTIEYEIKTEMVDDESKDNLDKSKKVQRRVLYISITSKSLDDMVKQYRFTPLQKKQLEELMDSEYSDLWASAIYSTSLGSSDMVQIALLEVGNKGGEKYWRWYGFNSRVEWCAVFVSWVADQAGYINTKVIPKFAGCQNGIDWFKAMGEWQERGYIPNPGDIIFFDWEHDGKVNHVGIVERVENNKVYTIEGNSTNDSCLQKNYDINSKSIFGYGTPSY